MVTGPFQYLRNDTEFKPVCSKPFMFKCVKTRWAFQVYSSLCIEGLSIQCNKYIHMCYKMAYPAPPCPKDCQMLKFYRFWTVIPDIYCSVPNDIIDRYNHSVCCLIPVLLSLLHFLFPFCHYFHNTTCIYNLQSHQYLKTHFTICIVTLSDWACY
jgi:hypothetical protein